MFYWIYSKAFLQYVNELLNQFQSGGSDRWSVETIKIWNDGSSNKEKKMKKKKDFEKKIKKLLLCDDWQRPSTSTDWVCCNFKKYKNRQEKKSSKLCLNVTF
jgi:hypothetical protein